jgi:hypothetical protein
MVERRIQFTNHYDWMPREEEGSSMMQSDHSLMELPKLKDVLQVDVGFKIGKKLHHD